MRRPRPRLRSAPIAGPVLALWSLFLLSGCAPRVAVTPSPVAAGAPSARAGGAVASAEPAATEVGLRILGRGGNAVDAAVGTALALAVVQPWAGNLGGGGFAVVRFGATVEVLDFRETGPAAAHPRLFLDADGAPLPAGSLVGPLAAATPGSPAGLHALQRRHGRLPWAEVVAPAVALARDGFTVSPRLHLVIEKERDLLRRFPGSARVWLPEGSPPGSGSHFRLPALAATLEAYAARGPEAITEGPAAAAIERAARAGGGILTAADLAAYRPVWREPLRFQAFGWEVASMPLPSSGGVILAASLGILERRGYASDRDPVRRAHLLIEAWRRAFADRTLLADPAWTEATAADLLAPAWLDQRAASIHPTRATPSDAIAPWARSTAGGTDRAAEGASAVSFGTMRAGREGRTTHLSVADGEGGYVALTTTLNGWFGCGLFIPEVGFFLNNEMDDFTTVASQPNLFDLVQGGANVVRAGARPLSSMAPTIAWRARETLVLGSPNGSRIPTAILQVFLAIAVDGDPIETAIDRPRLHHQWRPDAVRFEPEVPETLRRGLEAEGHLLEAAPWHIGEVQVVRQREGRLEAAADRRGPGGAGVNGAAGAAPRR